MTKCTAAALSVYSVYNTHTDSVKAKQYEYIAFFFGVLKKKNSVSHVANKFDSRFRMLVWFIIDWAMHEILHTHTLNIEATLLNEEEEELQKIYSSKRQKQSVIEVIAAAAAAAVVE